MSVCLIYELSQDLGKYALDTLLIYLNVMINNKDKIPCIHDISLRESW